MTTRRFLSSCFIIFAVALLTLSGCASSSSGTTSSGATLKYDNNTGVDVTHKTITLGILSPETGPVAAPIGIPLEDGVKAFFDHYNDLGGIDGYTVKFIDEDTMYDPTTELQKYNLIHNQVLMIADSLGTQPTYAINAAATADHMLVGAATLASSLAREQYLILLGTPYRLQVENAFDYVVKQLGISNPATGIIYQDDDYGADGLTGYKEAIAAYGLHDVAQAAYAPTDTVFTAQVLKMQKAGAKYVFLTTVPAATLGILATAFKLNYHPQWILQSPAFATVLETLPGVPALLDKAWIVGQGATWGDTSVPGMAQLLQDVAKYYPQQKPDGYFEFGYTEAHIIYAILKKGLDNHDITRNGLYSAFLSLNKVDLGGLYPPVTYGSSPNQRVPTRDSVIYEIDHTQTQTGDIKPLTSDFIGSAAAASQF